MGTTSIIITVLIITLLFVSLFCILYFTFILRKANKSIDKVNYLLDDLTHKSEILNPPIESLGKIFNYVDLFDFFVKKNVKSGLSLLRRNIYMVYRLVSNVKKLFGDEVDFKTTPKKRNKK